MNKLKAISGFILVSFASSSWAEQGWIVKLSRTQSASSFLANHGFTGRVLDVRSSARWVKIEAPKATQRQGASMLTTHFLQSMSGVEHVERDQVISLSMAPVKPVDPNDPAYGEPELTPNDPNFSKLWGLAGVGTHGSTRASHSWFHARNRNLKTVVVGVLDSGVRYEHEDLKPVLWSTKVDGVTVRGIDTVRGDFVADDESGHGTHVSGTIAAKAGNGLGVAGIAPNARIFPMKFLNAKGQGTMSAAIEAMDFAYEIPEIKVMNHSWGGAGSSVALEEAFERGRERGILMVVAAGNSKANNDSRVFYPANIPLDNVISVAAIDSKEKLASFSNYGLSNVHLGAPGVEIFSALHQTDVSYGSLSGTSMAAPHVAGAAAFILGLRPTWTYQEVRDHILRNVRPTSSISKKTSTGGTLDLYRAVRDL
jgi:hypothetical protein